MCIHLYSRRAILSALLRHGAHVLVFGTIANREDVMQMTEAVYTVCFCVYPLDFLGPS